MPTPNEYDAAAIFQTVFHEHPRTIGRFSMGLRHFVYDVVTESDTKVVVRIARGDDESLAGAVYWSQRLLPLGVPLPRILHADIQGKLIGYPFLALERFPGSDLGDVYSSLSVSDKTAIAIEVVRAQKLVNDLPQGKGFGYAPNYGGLRLHTSWNEVIEASLTRSQKRMTTAGVFNPGSFVRVLAKVQAYEDYLAGIRPVAFLDDTTTKNVIVHQGRLSGIVDVDVVCFGDPVWTIALTQMALLSRGLDLDYAKIWSDLLDLTLIQRQTLKLYTVIFCVDFMSEVGHAFNRDGTQTVDESYAERLAGVFEDLMQEV
jgi:aminoglycoside phosphotransferase (APT) family kinase protein